MPAKTVDPAWGVGGVTPAARVAAAIDILDDIFSGTPAEKALSGWSRSHRFAGSKDRAALRDHVFDALRRRRSSAALGGSATGRGVMIGEIRAAGIDPASIFTGEGYAPRDLEPGEAGATPALPGSAAALDCPDWLMPLMRDSLGARSDAVLDSLRSRAPVFLRVNLRLGTREAAIRTLEAEEIGCVASPLSESALMVTHGARRIAGSQARASGLVELQDAASQAATDLVPVSEGARVLDYCAGGGGKTLAIGGRVEAEFFAHDANTRRMSDLPVRAARARIDVRRLATGEIADHAPFDVVLVDAPCSGSGSWRRDPQGKWALTPDRLDDLVRLQARILDETAPMVAPQGQLVYVTCSVLAVENEAQIEAFLVRHVGWACHFRRWFTPDRGGDGFFVARLTQASPA